MSTIDIRWIQRFNNFSKAFKQLTKFIEKGELSELEQQGLIQSFEYNYELAWNTIKDFYENQGETGIQGSRDAIRMAFKRGLIVNGDIWMKMIKGRTLTSHTYNEDTADEIAKDISNIYYNEFLKLQETFILLKEKAQSGK
ncbi:nucleotidyltransferase substrate binding protein [Desulfobacula sp.]|uniref:nucleotidyltransferase substrate binding protein n=1 Tax=Desulfobacula sp. TaxID=2593537 RepID=UPI00262EB18D|nr:nucleotidyltransferase substrate binding protein [Desulfobacula sp.]